VTVHVTTGNGGPPGFNDPADYGGSIPSTNQQSVNYGRGRVSAHNATHLEFTQINNKDSSVQDHWFLVQHEHGPRKH
jgi:hypothetical protein